MTSKPRLTILGLSLAVSVALVALQLRLRQAGPGDSFEVAPPDGIEAVAAERAAALAAGTSAVAWRYGLSEEHARTLFTFRGGKVYDPWLYFRDRPDRHDRIEWPEHPDGFYVHETNSLGYRDEERGPRADLEVFVVGDSNTAGVCNLDESYSNRLEALLGEARPGASVTVTNMGTGGHGLYSYLGAIERATAETSDLFPDVFVVSVFGGNDFSGALLMNAIFQGGPAPPWDGEPAERRRAALERDMQLMTHCLNSTMIFKSFPELEDLAVEVALGLAAEMKAACDRVGTRLVVLYIPEPCLFAWSPPLAGAAEIREILQADDGDCASSSRIADRFLAGLDALDVTGVDLRPAFAALPAPPYWRRDLHMNVEAHEIAARALFDRLR